MTREIPLLVCSDMVKALLAGRKTMTRRMRGLDQINADPDGWRFVEVRGNDFGCWAMFLNNRTQEEKYILFPYRVGDRIWWRETWMHYGNKYEAGRSFALVRYRADEYLRECPCENPPQCGGSDNPAWKRWRASIHMPKWACRLWSEIVEVLPPQRVQEITGPDALAEGCSVEAIQEWLNPIATKARVEPLHWLHGVDDDARPYCYRCACRRAKKLRSLPKNSGREIVVDGGWGGEEDSPQHCDVCGVRLEACLTRYGVSEEMAYTEENGIYPSANGVYNFYDMLDGGDIPSDDDDEDVPDFANRVARIGYRWLWERRHGPGAWEKNFWVWPIRFKMVEDQK